MQKKAILIIGIILLLIASFVSGIIYLLTMPAKKTALKSSIIQPQKDLTGTLEPHNEIFKNTNNQNFSGTISILIPIEFKSQSLHRFFAQYGSGNTKIKITYLTSSIGSLDFLQTDWDIALVPSMIAKDLQDNVVKASSTEQVNALFFYPVQEWLEKQGMILIPFAIDFPVFYVDEKINEIYPISNITPKNIREILLIGKKLNKQGKIANYPVLIGLDKLTHQLLKRDKFDLFPNYNIWLYLFAHQYSLEYINFIFQPHYTNWSYSNLKKESKICKKVYKINDLRLCLLKRQKTFAVPGFTYEQKLFKNTGTHIYPLYSDKEYPILIWGWVINKKISSQKLTKIQSIFQEYLRKGANMYGWWPNSLSAFQKALIYQQNYSKYKNMQIIRDILKPDESSYAKNVIKWLQNLEF